MATLVRKEVRKRGFFGWIFLLLFLAFNGLMLWWLVAAGAAIGGMGAQTEAEQAGRAIGGALGIGMILFVWVAGSVILGLLAILTRGRKTIITETVQ